MTLKILEEKNNSLFKRREIKAVIASEITPSRNAILELLSKKFDAPADNIDVRRIKGKFGTKDFGIEANIYSSKEEKEIVELKKKKKSGEITVKKEVTTEKSASAPEKPVVA